MTQRRIYQEEYPYFVTFRTCEGCPLFEDGKMAEWMAGYINNAGALKHHEILAYQIMPDHIHVLVHIEQPRMGDRTLERVRSGVMERVAPKTERTFSNVRSVRTYTISDLIQSIKGNFSRNIHIGNIWQRRFHARIINTSNYLHTVIKYIQNNPAKARLPEKYYHPPYRHVNWPKIPTLF